MESKLVEVYKIAFMLASYIDHTTEVVPTNALLALDGKEPAFADRETFVWRIIKSFPGTTNPLMRTEVVFTQ